MSINFSGFCRTIPYTLNLFLVQVNVWDNLLPFQELRLPDNGIISYTMLPLVSFLSSFFEAKKRRKTRLPRTGKLSENNVSHGLPTPIPQGLRSALLHSDGTPPYFSPTLQSGSSCAPIIPFYWGSR